MKKFRPGFADAKSVLIEGFDGAGIVAEGATVPTNGVAGYHPGCLFFKRAGTAGTQVYINEGTAASCDFNAMGAVTAISLSGLTATAAEINQHCDESANSEVVITTRPILAADSGKTFYLSLAAGFTCTLPAPALGLRYKFRVKTAPTGAPYIITTTASATIMFGMMVERAGGAGVAGASEHTFNFIHAQSIVGDWVEFDSDGTNWYYRGMTDVSAGSTAVAT
jgi:hypothetical protein